MRSFFTVLLAMVVPLLWTISLERADSTPLSLGPFLAFFLLTSILQGIVIVVVNLLIIRPNVSLLEAEMCDKLRPPIPLGEQVTVLAAFLVSWDEGEKLATPKLVYEVELPDGRYTRITQSDLHAKEAPARFDPGTKLVRTIAGFRAVTWENGHTIPSQATA